MKIQDKRSNIRKEPRVIRMSHRAYLLTKAMAEKQEIGIGPLFELLIQEAAAGKLTEEERAEVNRHAQEIIEARTQEVEALEKSGAA